MNHNKLISTIHKNEHLELDLKHKRQLRSIKSRPPGVKPDSMWLVVYECRYEVIRVSPLGDGFFAPGQEPCWAFDNVAEWIREIENNSGKNEVDNM